MYFFGIYNYSNTWKTKNTKKTTFYIKLAKINYTDKCPLVKKKIKCLSPTLLIKIFSSEFFQRYFGIHMS